MANLVNVKVEKDGQVKTITSNLMPYYLSNGWVEHKDKKSTSVEVKK